MNATLQFHYKIIRILYFASIKRGLSSVIIISQSCLSVIQINPVPRLPSKGVFLVIIFKLKTNGPVTFSRSARAAVLRSPPSPGSPPRTAATARKGRTPLRHRQTDCLFGSGGIGHHQMSLHRIEPPFAAFHRSVKRFDIDSNKSGAAHNGNLPQERFRQIFSNIISNDYIL